MEGQWPTQDAKQRLSELLRRAQVDGPQVVTKHGEEVAVVLDIMDYRRLAGLEIEVDFKQAIVRPEPLSDEAAEVFDGLAVERRHDLPRDVDLGASR